MKRRQITRYLLARRYALPAALAISCAALSACDDHESDESVSWETSESDPGAVPLVDNGAGGTQLPDRVPIELILGTTPTRSYVGTSWTLEDGPETDPTTIRFTEDSIVYVGQDGESRSASADYRAEHESCLEYPGCLVTTAPSGMVTIHYLYREGNQFWFVRCIDYGEPERVPTVPELEAAENVVVWQGDAVVCLAHYDQPGYALQSVPPVE